MEPADIARKLVKIRARLIAEQMEGRMTRKDKTPEGQIRALQDIEDDRDPRGTAIDLRRRAVALQVNAKTGERLPHDKIDWDGVIQFVTEAGYRDRESQARRSAEQ